MPLGEPIRETGLLLRERGALILERDEGGRWRLDVPRPADAWLGQRVTIVATRAGFDLLDVEEIGRLDGTVLFRERSWPLRFELAVIGVLTVAGLSAALLWSS